MNYIIKCGKTKFCCSNSRKKRKIIAAEVEKKYIDSIQKGKKIMFNPVS